MKQFLLFFTTVILSSFSFGQNFKQSFVAADIDNFWKAYDKIVATPDSMQQVAYLKDLYIDKGSPGLKSLLAVRGYTPKEFIDAINNYPRFWASLRANTVNTNELYTSIETDIHKLKKIYPDLKPSTIYFLIGAFRTGGTIQEDRVLIGSELSLADNTTMIGEHPQWRKAFYKEYEPRKNIALLCTHEYIHTQQKPFVENLLSMCLYEGVAEFISCLATGKPSNSPAIAFGKKNQEKVVNQFVADLFLMSNNSSWLWGENRNELRACLKFIE